MRRLAAETFDRPGLVVCEGAADRQFLTRLLADRGIGSRLQVLYPATEGDWSGGKSKIGKYLSGASLSETFIKNVKAILIVADSDDDPNGAFNEIREELERADFPVPSAPGEFAAHGAGGAVVRVLLLPIGAPGNLETICLSPLYAKWNLQAAIDAFVAATPAMNWTVGKQSKMRVQSIMAATCETKPDTSFANHWHLREEFHLPISDPSFDPIAAQLKEFEDWIEV